jgi:DNA-directed RNA polymerase subunit H (RpoH/RPB5)
MSKELDVSKHVLVPKHVKLSDKEKKDLFEKYVADLRDLPRIYKDDPALSSLDVKEGDVIRISRRSMTAGEALFYRRVVNR